MESEWNTSSDVHPSALTLQSVLTISEVKSENEDPLQSTIPSVLSYNSDQIISFTSGLAFLKDRASQ